MYYTYAAACLYYMGLYSEAESMALQVSCFLMVFVVVEPELGLHECGVAGGGFLCCFLEANCC